MDIATAPPPEIFDPVRLRAELGEPQGDAAPSGNELTDRMRQAFREGRARVRERFEAGGGAEAVHRELTRQTDVLIQGALDYAEGHVYGTSTRAPARSWRWWPSAATAAASWRRCPTSTSCSCTPTSRRRWGES